MNHHRNVIPRTIGLLAACATLMLGQAVFAADSGDTAPLPQCGGEKPVGDAKPKPKPKPLPVPAPAAVSDSDAVPLCGGEKPVGDAKPKPKPKPLPVPAPA